MNTNIFIHSINILLNKLLFPRHMRNTEKQEVRAVGETGLCETLTSRLRVQTLLNKL